MKLAEVIHLDAHRQDGRAPACDSLTLPEVMQAHRQRGGVCDHIAGHDGRVRVGFFLVAEDADTLEVGTFELDADPVCVAHDVGLPPELWDRRPGRWWC